MKWIFGFLGGAHSVDFVCLYSMVCFPYAGGNSNFYKTWDFKDTEMVLVELPGRNAYVIP